MLLGAIQESKESYRIKRHCQKDQNTKFKQKKKKLSRCEFLEKHTSRNHKNINPKSEKL